jgi:riboflavin biosynthesis pyrimidine reductase
LVGSPLQARLLDVLEIFIVPVLIGAGHRLFETHKEIPLTLTESRPFDNGVLLTRYTSAR